jgi:endo-1,4-beta-xylanase
MLSRKPSQRVEPRPLMGRGCLAAGLLALGCGSEPSTSSVLPNFAGNGAAGSSSVVADPNANPPAAPGNNTAGSSATSPAPSNPPNGEQLAPDLMNPVPAGQGGGSSGTAGASGSNPPTTTPPASAPPTPIPVPPDGVVGPVGRDILDFTSLKQAASASGRRIGVALDAGPLGEQVYRDIAVREFNYATAANEMKWDSLQPQPNQFNYARADQIVNFAEQNGLDMKGHTLIWFRQLPNWVQQLSGAAAVRQAMLNHITTVVSRFRGRVVAWDVVNEAWNDDGLSLRDLIFQRTLGDGYIDEAFRAARAADPNAKLYYNDFGTEDLSAKSDAVYTMLEGMLERGVPIDGVGLQMHTLNINGAPTIADFIANIDRLAALGLDVVISEMDISTCASGGTVPERLEAQRQRVYNLVAACVTRPACTEITLWGLTDRYSWLDTNPDISQCENGQQPLGLLFDSNYQAKPAYAGALSAFRVAR